MILTRIQIVTCSKIALEAEEIHKNVKARTEVGAQGQHVHMTMTKTTSFWGTYEEIIL